jgi:transposase
MRDRELYQRILGIESPWEVTDVALDLERGEVRVEVAMQKDRLPCPECAVDAPTYDSRPRRWRHLDTCQYRTILEALVPRVKWSRARRASGPGTVG